MKNFDMTRFGRVLKLDFIEGYKSMLWGALCMTLLYLFFFWFAHNLSMHSLRYDHIHDPIVRNTMIINYICEAVSGFSVMAVFIFFLISASTLFRSEQKKQKRIAWMMLPASNLEKFLSRWGFLMVFSLVGGILPFFIADLIHIAYLSMTDYPVMTATDDFIGFVPKMSSYAPNIWVNMLRTCLLYICIHSFFLLGGVFFKKFHFIATSAVMVIGLSVIFTITNALHLYTIFNLVDIFLYTGLTVLFTWLAYWLFCRWQVVTYKFVNL